MNNWKKVILNAKNTMKNAIEVLELKGQGIIMVANNQNKLIGTITDGDIRHMLEKQNDISSLAAKDIISKNPIKVDAELLAFDVLTTLKTKGIGQLIVQDLSGTYIGMIHILDLIKEGIE